MLILEIVESLERCITRTYNWKQKKHKTSNIPRLEVSDIEFWI